MRPTAPLASAPPPSARHSDEKIADAAGRWRPTIAVLILLGVTVFAGMIGVTLFGILITPVCYYLLESLSTSLGAAPAAATNRSGRPPALNSP